MPELLVLQHKLVSVFLERGAFWPTSVSKSWILLEISRAGGATKMSCM